MPRPPILPTIDWRELFVSGAEYAEWLRSGESPTNQAKMEALRENVVIESQDRDFLAGLARAVHVVAIAEDWCGDVVRHVPVLQRLADECSQLRVRYFSREERPEVFIRYLTNGGEAIPRFVFLSQEFVECGNWGPMPSSCRELIARGKACGDVGAARKKVALLYEADAKRREVIDELLHLIDVASCARP